jgi:hypothetical protein
MLVMMLLQCDGATGVVKSYVRRAVRARRVIISNSKEMFKFCKENMTISGKNSRQFFHVESITRGPRAWRSADRKQTGKKPDFKICLICVFSSIS